MSPLYLFTGGNAYALREEKRKWCEQFASKHGAENLLTLDGQTLQFRSLLDEVGSAPFIASKRLVVVLGVPKFTKEEVESLPGHIHPDCILLFCDAAPDKRLSGVKSMMKVATVKEFSPLTGRPLLEWMNVSARSTGLGSDAAAALLDTVGEDQDVLMREIEKLSLFASGRSITRQDVTMLAVPSGEQEVWRLTNLLAAGKPQEALVYVRTLLQSGEDPFSVWNILLWMLRGLVGTAVLCSEGQTNPAKIASAIGMPFPTVRAILPLASATELREVRGFLDWAVQTDIELKTGGYRATSEAPQELLALIDRFILQCGELGKLTMKN